MEETLIWYKYTYLAKNSDAYKLYEAKEFDKLDKHLLELKKQAQKADVRMS